MRTDRETKRLVRSWLLDGPTELPDRVLDAVLDQLPATSQRRATPLARLRSMPTVVAYGLAAAAVVAAILIGVNGLGRSNMGAPSLDNSSPTAEPSPSPDAGLPEGEHHLWFGAERGALTMVTIPAAGWYGEPGGGILESGPPELDFAPADAGMIGPFVGEMYVPADPCEWLTTMPDAPATTVDELVAALQSQASRNASEPVDITVDGHSGKSITLYVPDDAEFDECHRREYCTLSDRGPTVCQRFQQFPGQIDEVWILDVDGELMVFFETYGEGTPAADRAELQAIFESLTFPTP